MKKNKFLKLKPMLLHEIDKPFNDDNYIFEIKFDGIRALIYMNNDEIIIKSRNNIILNNNYPELLELKKLTKSTCILDGEIVLFDNGKPSFSKLLERVRLKNKETIKNYQIKNPVTFVCFDILYKDYDLTNKTLIERKKILNEFKNNDIFIKTKYYENIGKKLFNFVKKEDLEGIIAKLKESKYTYGIRTKEWIKIKNFKHDKFYICGYINEEDKYIITLVLGELKNNKYYYVGKVILSKKDKLYNKLLKEKVLKDSTLENYDNKNITYIKPSILIDVYYIERTKNNLLRQPFIKKPQLDK